MAGRPTLGEIRSLAAPHGQRIEIGPHVHMRRVMPCPQVCLQLTLLPRRFVRDAEPHDFTLYTGQIPADVRARPGAMPFGNSAVLVREG